MVHETDKYVSQTDANDRVTVRANTPALNKKTIKGRDRSVNVTRVLRTA